MIFVGITNKIEKEMTVFRMYDHLIIKSLGYGKRNDSVYTE